MRFMTETSTTPATITSTAAPEGEGPGSSGFPDLRPSFDVVVDLAGELIAKIQPSGLRWPTPCSEYDVGQLCGHFVAVIQRVAAVGRLEDPWSVPQEVEGLEPAGFSAAWAAAVADQRQVWSDDAVLSETLVLPFGEMPGGIALATYIGEVLVHTWDLATAVGVAIDWPTEIVEGAVVGATMGLPAEGRGAFIPFDPVVPTAADASPIDRLVAWMGRRP